MAFPYLYIGRRLSKDSGGGIEVDPDWGVEPLSGPVAMPLPDMGTMDR